MSSVVDYLGCILVKLIGPLIRLMPKPAIMFLGRRIGDLFYYFDYRHKPTAYANIKAVFAGELSPPQISGLTRKFFQTFGQNIMEVFMIPLVDQEYIKKYVSIEGLGHVREAFRHGRGAILLGVHEGSWELSNIICANLGFSFVLLVRDQRHPRLDKLLNRYRTRCGCKIVQRENETRQLICALKDNQAIGMTLDQGGKTGTQVKFFGRDASFATGAIRLALKYGAPIIPGFYVRVNGPYIKVIFEAPFTIKRTADSENDIQANLEALVPIYEKYILRYPQEYLWSYKIWKYSKEMRALILSDGKTGHLRQSQAFAKILGDYLKEKDIKLQVKTVEVVFKNRLFQRACVLSNCLSGKYNCQGCLWCLKACLTPAAYNSLIGLKPDIIVSCGQKAAPINFLLSRENLAKSVVIMRPSLFGTDRFDLVLLPRHDRPPRRKNIVVTEGALNLIDENYLKSTSDRLIQGLRDKAAASRKYIGLLIGGDTKNFSLAGDVTQEALRQIKSAAEKLDIDILATTSRRTSKEVEAMVKKELADYPRCRLLVIANEKNIPGAVGGILGLSQIVIATPESISMISEAVSSNKYVLVFQAPGLGKKHRRFLQYFAQNRYLYLAESAQLSRAIEELWHDRPPVKVLADNAAVRFSLKRII